METDKLDEAILSELLVDGRQSFREIAKKAKCSVVTVGWRIKKMQEEGIVKGFSALIEQSKLGYDITTIMEVTVSKGKLKEVQEQIAKMRNVCGVYDVTGVEDSIVISKFKNREELSDFTKEVLAIPHVERTNTHVVLNTFKEDFRYPYVAAAGSNSGGGE